MPRVSPSFLFSPASVPVSSRSDFGVALRATAVGSPKKPVASYSLTRVCAPPLVLCKSLGLGVVCLENRVVGLLTGH
jgi:hypothetical protein